MTDEWDVLHLGALGVAAALEQIELHRRVKFFLLLTLHIKQTLFFK